MICSKVDSEQCPKLADVHRTPFYCEENVYFLCMAIYEQYAKVDLYVVFISNMTKQVLRSIHEPSGDAGAYFSPTGSASNDI